MKSNEAMLVVAADQPIETNLSITDDLFVKWYCIHKADSFVPQHVHAFDHVTVIAFGGIEAWQDQEFLGEYRAPASLVIPAGKKHTFKTLADNTMILCVHALNGEGEPRVMEEHQLVECRKCHLE